MPPPFNTVPRTRVRTRAHIYIHTHIHTHKEYICTRTQSQWNGPPEIHSTRVLLQLELLKTLFNAGFPKCPPAYTRLQLIAESFRPIDFHETDARLYYRHAQLERLLVTRCSARFFSLFSFFQRKIFVRFSCNPLPRSTRYQISFLTRYYSEQLRFFVYLSFTKFYAVEKQVTLRWYVSLSNMNTSNFTSSV